MSSKIDRNQDPVDRLSGIDSVGIPGCCERAYENETEPDSNGRSPNGSDR
jgi:hypothetical protein